MKPGYKTTEFYFTIVLQIVGILVMTGVFTPEQQESIDGLVGSVVMVLSAFGYSVSRGLAKQNAPPLGELLHGSLEETTSGPQ